MLPSAWDCPCLSSVCFFTKGFNVSPQFSLDFDTFCDTTDTCSLFGISLDAYPELSYSILLQRLRVFRWSEKSPFSGQSSSRDHTRYNLSTFPSHHTKRQILLNRGLQDLVRHPLDEIVPRLFATLCSCPPAFPFHANHRPFHTAYRS